MFPCKISARFIRQKMLDEIGYNSTSDMTDLKTEIYFAGLNVVRNKIQAAKSFDDFNGVTHEFYRMTLNEWIESL